MSAPTITRADGPVWRPFSDDPPLLTPAMAAGPGHADPDDEARLRAYLAALVAARRAPVHLNVAFNAVYFGYDLTTGGYVGGIELDALPQVRTRARCEALPVGALVTIPAGENPVYGEVVYKEGAHPLLGADGDLPDWVSGAPAGASGPGQATASGERTGEPAAADDADDADDGAVVLSERLVVDYAAFGADLATPAQLHRLRQRARHVETDGHLLVEAAYRSRDDADADEATYYRRWLLGPGRALLDAPTVPRPLRAVLRADVTDRDALLPAALEGIFATIAAALAGLEELRSWRGYVFTRDAFAQRLASAGPLHHDDLSAVASGLAAVTVPERASIRFGTTRRVRYTAIGPRLRGISGAPPLLLDTGYAAAVVHANAAVSDYVRGESDEQTGLLPNSVHLRLDDPWQGGGVWRAEYPDSAYAHVDPLRPLALGWAGTVTVPDEAPAADPQPEPEPTPDPTPEPEPEPEPELDQPALLAVSDTHVAWTQVLRLAYLIDGRLPLPARIAEELPDAPAFTAAGGLVRLSLHHDGHELDTAEADQDKVPAQLDPLPAQLRGIAWPIEFLPGLVLNCSWARGGRLIEVRTTLLDEPVEIDGMPVSHRYDPRAFTRDTAPGSPARGRGEGPGIATLGLRERVLRAVRRHGLVEPDGRAVLRRSAIATRVYGAAVDRAAVLEVDRVVDQLITDGRLRDDVAGLGPGSTVRWPSEPGDLPVPVVVYEPGVVKVPRAGAPRPARREDGLELRYLRTEHVVGHLRRLRPGHTASDEARAAFAAYRRELGYDAKPLPRGFTFVVEHDRRR